MKVIIHHAPRMAFMPTLEEVATDFATGNYVKVAAVEATDLEDAYRLSNSIESLWTDNVEVVEKYNLQECKGKFGARSSSVGDVFEVDGVFHAVLSIGFKPLP